MTTGEDIVKEALIEIGVLGDGVTPQSNMGNRALNKLNWLVQTLNNSGQFIYEIVDETQTITASTGSYSIGSGATWDTDRPVRVERMLVRDSNDYDRTLVEYNSDQWADITDKTTTSSYPEVYYYDKTYPNGIINLWPVPNQGLTAVLYTWKQVAAFTLAGTVSLPPGYEEYLILKLAARLAPSYEKPVSRDLKNQIWEAENLLAGSNPKPTQTKVDPALVRRGHSYNVYTDR